jgi:rare lipoprotein A
MKNFLAVILLLAVSACSSMQAPTDAGRGTYKVGKPYQIDGVIYVPQEDYSYDETGIASWYGPGFHGRNTANGETFDTNQLTAAHRTLPMPSLVRVTNLENGKSVVARVNDRGPFARNRIIDMSKRGAELLGFIGNGTAKVRVEILAEESRAIADAARQKGRYVAGSTRNASEVPAPRAAPVDSVATVSLENDSLAPITVTDKANVTGPNMARIERAETANRYLPPVKSTTVAVPSSAQIYVQAGAFTKQANATKLAEALGGIGKAQISEADVNGLRFFRVRLPAGDVAAADKILARVISAGQQGAKIVIGE